MKKPLCLAALLLAFSTLAASPAFADHDVTGDFSGKTKCENGMKKAGFKDPDTNNVTWYSLNDVARAAKAMSWDDPEHPMSFDDREKRKTALQHVQKVLRDMSCDTSDNPAQSGNGLLPGAHDSTSNPTANSTMNGTRKNGYNQPTVNGQ